jgi:glycosyltransferase involved in cell wall biosynthesis
LILQHHPTSLLVFADDWGRHPSSCQHLVRHLLPRHEVGWVNTIGTRRPRLDLATLARGLEKLRHWSRKAATPEPLPAGLRLFSPKMLPWFSPGVARKLNRELLRRQLTPFVRSLPAPVVAVTTLPIVADLVGLLPVERWVYYCVDDFGLWPGLDQATLRQMEEKLVEQADVLIAVSETLQDKLADMGRPAHLLTHGVEPAFWEATGPRLPLPQLDGLERPFVLFWGVLDRRMDLRFLERLAADLDRGTIVLVGPQADPDPALLRCRRAHILPPVAFEQLPQLAREAGVLVMPYADLPVTRAIQPLKLKEYLATGKPVVVRDLPATRPWADCLDLAGSPEAFSAAVRARLAQGLPGPQQRARARLAEENWAEKARAFAHWACGQEASLDVACPV